MKALLLCILMFTWFILTSCDGLVYVDNPVEKETKTAKELAAKALIGTWKHVPKKHRHENYQSTDFLVIPANGKIKSNLYNKPDFNESTFTLDSDWLFYPNDSSLSGHLYTDIIPGGNKFLIKIKGTDMILQPDMGYLYPNDPTRYFEKVELNNMNHNIEVSWNPLDTDGGLDVNGNYERPTYIGLAHELAHAYDMISNGSIDETIWIPAHDTYKAVGVFEKTASIIENRIRMENSLPQRAYYLSIRGKGYAPSSLPIFYPNLKRR